MIDESRTEVSGADAPSQSLIYAYGAMAAQVRAFPWDTTPLGSLETWPIELVFVVDQMLYSPWPSYIFWGPEFINLYNDAILPALAGKHPASLGRPACKSGRRSGPSSARS